VRLEKANRRLQLELKGTNEQQEVQNRQVRAFLLPLLAAAVIFVCTLYEVPAPIKPLKLLVKIYNEAEYVYLKDRPAI